MPNKVNYLLGRAERLVRRIPPPPIKPTKTHPYTFEQAQQRVVPKIISTVAHLAAIPRAACPQDEAVALFTLHPSYLAKSYFPDDLLRETNLRAVGSRQRMVSPEAWAIRNPPEEALSAELFVAGKREDFARFATLASQWTADARAADDLRKVEDVRSYPVEERLRLVRTQAQAPFWEIILHATQLPESDFILEAFRDYRRDLDLRVNLDDRLHAQGLCFLPARVPRGLIQSVATFSFLRVAREMPKMRPVVRASGSSPKFAISLPDGDVMDPTIRVATFDGGLPAKPDLSRWTNRRKTNGLGRPHPVLQEHGLGVTSALLFGPVEDGVPLPQPYATVDHFRVFDATSADDDTDEYFAVIKRVMGILETGRYDFANFSIGPDLPIEEDNVHVWTAMLDQFLTRGGLLASIAVGNSGDKDHASGTARSQTPSDYVNAPAVGSADCLGPGWKRSSHSCIGPGRSPGKVKPDALGFGGCPKTPFYVIGTSGKAEGRIGTSFASPAALRMAVGVRAHLGPVLSPLALKALLVQRSDRAEHPQVEIGWGKISESIEVLVTSDDSTAHIVYQGDMIPGSWIRADSSSR